MGAARPRRLADHLELAARSRRRRLPVVLPGARSALHGRLRTSLSSAAGGIRADIPAARDLRHLLAACQRFIWLLSPPRIPPPAGESVLFDGGSRGNLGPGGAGAVVLRVDRLQASSTVVWSTAMSLASPRTANNQAEFLGLVTGLAVADRRHWRPLSVVGDSQLIITQLQQYRPPKNTVLRRFYYSAHHLADGLGITRWSHHSTRRLTPPPTSPWILIAASRLIARRPGQNGQA